MWVETQIPQGLVPGLEQVPMRGRSLYETLERNYGLVLRRAERWIEAVAPTAEQAALLGVDPGERCWPSNPAPSVTPICRWNITVRSTAPPRRGCS
jgi:DNA-binding GntR family transcriptional regulator